MSSAEPDAADVFQRLVVPAVFGAAEPQVRPALVLVSGQPGSGTMGGVARSSRSLPGAAALHTDELLAFHPDFYTLGRRHPTQVRDALDDAVSAWLAETLAHALETRRSLILGGSFPTTTVSGLIDAFSGAGFTTELAVVAARRSESLLTSLAAFLESRRLRLPAAFVSVRDHQQGWDDVESVLATLHDHPRLNRLTVTDRSGSVLFDSSGSEAAATPDSAAGPLREGWQPRWTPRSAAAWLGELRRITEYARASRELTGPVAEVLLELQLLALHEVLPELPLRTGSPVIREQERRIGAELVDLRKVLAEATPAEQAPAPVPVSAPEYVPPSPPDRGGPSL